MSTTLVWLLILYGAGYVVAVLLFLLGDDRTADDQTRDHIAAGVRALLYALPWPITVVTLGLGFFGWQMQTWRQGGLPSRYRKPKPPPAIMPTRPIPPPPPSEKFP